jgi:phospholipid/cholesterol/gamma-HCH transport system substrate-binding protein
MESKRLVTVGIFVLGGLVLFMVGLFLIGDRRMLFTESFEVWAEFHRISGLQSGARVRVAGMAAGEVLEIRVPGGPRDRFRVRMRIRSDLHPVVRTDSVASIQTDGLVGAKVVQVEAGSEEAPVAPEGSTIRSQEPFDLADLMEQMQDTVHVVHETMVELRGDLGEAVFALTDMARNANEVVGEAGEDIRAITTAGRRVTDDAVAIMDDIRAGRGTIGSLVYDDRLYRQAIGITEEAKLTMENVRRAAEEARAAVEGFRTDESPAHGITADLRLTLQHARESMANLAENTEALKRNWLFRGFFRERGFFDLDRIPADEYLEGALETRDRRVLRIWLGADVLFAPGAEGVEELTAGGRARLDSAMAEFLRYPRQSPLVVEGYAEAATRDRRYLLARHRADLVRRYLMARFQIDASHVGTMPLPDRLPEASPAGDRWSGVGLALFVERAAVAGR